MADCRHGRCSHGRRSPGIAAQCGDPRAAARVGVFVHAWPGDAAARGGERGVLASDVIARAARLRQSVKRRVRRPARTEAARRGRSARDWRARRPPAQRSSLWSCPHRRTRRRQDDACGRGLLRALRSRGPVRSPTYTLARTVPLHGADHRARDLYRLRDPAELETWVCATGPQPGHLWLVEWPERGAGQPACAGPEHRSSRSAGRRSARARAHRAGRPVADLQAWLKQFRRKGSRSSGLEMTRQA